MSTSDDTDWIAVDWGTTNLRAWLMRDGAAVAAVSTQQGMASLGRDAFEPALIAALADWLSGGSTIKVIACGMVGARQGWREAPYVAVPSPPLVAARMIRVPVSDARIDVSIVHGLSQAAPPDVMRGEETQLAGLMAAEPGFEGIVCLPGTHSKWVTIRDGRVEGFRTFMTGELFALLAGHSVLRHAVEGAAGEDTAAFDAGVGEAARAPAALAARLFSIRAATLIDGLGPVAARSRLSGLLIGLEIEGMIGDLAGEMVTIVGTDALSALYERALRLRGGKARRLDGSGLTLRGLAAAHRLVMQERAQ